MKDGPVTIWNRFDKEHQMFEFNHIEEGHCVNNEPTAIDATQKKMWQNMKWEKKFTTLENSKVIE